MYADYSFYQEVYFGDKIPLDDWAKYASRASDYIDYVTGGKAKAYNDVNDYVKKACCAVAEAIASAETAKSSMSVASIASETVGSHSISFRSGADIDASMKAEMLSAVQMYLFPTGLMYRGVPCIRRIP